MHRLASAILALVVLTGCVVGPTARHGDADIRFVRHDDMAYRTLEIGAARDGPLVVVVEGDGVAWRSPDRPPRNPTPRDPVGMRIAERLAQDRPVLHLGRPCQFLAGPEGSPCGMRWWTRDRYAEAVVASYAHTIEAARRGRRIVLVGHSGGGVIAAELALRLSDVDRLVTLAAPLDLAAWTAFHGVTAVSSPSGGALPDRLAASPLTQMHLFGARDDVVPPEVTRAARARLGPTRASVADGMVHDGRWESLIVSAMGERRD